MLRTSAPRIGALGVIELSFMKTVEPVRFESRSGMLLAGIRRHHDFATAHVGIPNQWAEFRASGPIINRIGSEAYGVTCGHSQTSFEYMCAVEVHSFDGISDETGRMKVPDQRYAIFVHEGPMPEIADTWQGILNWLATGEYESAHTPDFERYDSHFITGAPSNKVEIWVGIKPKSSNAA